MRHFVLVAGMILVFSGAALGATYYVATNGSDSNPGTQAQPWATLQKAVDTIANGDTAIVTPGTYVGCRARYSGASGAPKTLMAQTPGTVLVNAAGPVNRRTSNIEIQNNDGISAVDYWVIDGFEIANAVAWGVDAINGNYLTVRNCTAHNNGISSGKTGIFSAYGDFVLVEDNTSYSNGEHGIYVNNSADDGVVRRNHCYSNTSLGVHMNGDKSQHALPDSDGIMTNWVVEKNVCENNGSNGFDGDGVEYTIWRNNLAYGNASKGIHLTAVNGSVEPRYDKIYNNTLVVPIGGYYPVNFLKGRPKTGGNNNSVMNNIVYNYDINNTMRGSIMYVSAWMSTFTSDYNVVVNRFAVDDNRTKYTLAQWQSTWGKDLHSTLCLDANALFVDAANGNYHLKATSPAINAGTTLTEVTDDIEGWPRTAGSYDCGCYEFH
jgi:parallel beta-helix repeat protein